jgi:hypothetical protein
MGRRVVRPWSTLFCATILLPAIVHASGRAPAISRPQYDRATVTDVSGVIAEIRETPAGPLPGLHLFVRTEKKLVDIYVGPALFVKDFGVTFIRGQEIRATGSRTRSDTGDVVLAREVRRHDVTVYLRDHDGKPLWKE